jgi:hypothetical protein
MKHILISLTSFMGTPNSMRILYNTSLLTELQAFLESKKSDQLLIYYIKTHTNDDPK